MRKELFLLLVLGIILISGCTQQNTQTAPKQEAKQECIQLCQEMKDEMDLSQGPCLSGVADWNVSGWVCDVAHEPRQAVDNKRENQCDEWHSGKAENFVEVTPQCKFIRTG